MRLCAIESDFGSIIYVGEESVSIEGTDMLRCDLIEGAMDLGVQVAGGESGIRILSKERLHQAVHKLHRIQVRAVGGLTHCPQVDPVSIDELFDACYGLGVVDAGTVELDVADLRGCDGLSNSSTFEEFDDALSSELAGDAICANHPLGINQDGHVVVLTDGDVLAVRNKRFSPGPPAPVCNVGLA